MNIKYSLDYLVIDLSGQQLKAALGELKNKLKSRGREISVWPSTAKPTTPMWDRHVSLIVDCRWAGRLHNGLETGRRAAHAMDREEGAAKCVSIAERAPT